MENVLYLFLNYKEADDKKETIFKSDVVLNNKQIRKNKAEQAKKDAAEQDYTGMTRSKQTNNRMDIRNKILEDKNNVEKEVYNTENIPRTKKIQKMEMKKQIKKMKKTGKNNLLLFKLELLI